MWNIKKGGCNATTCTPHIKSHSEYDIKKQVLIQRFSKTGCPFC